MSFHPFHLVDPSPWPFLGASAAFFLTFGSVVYFHFSLSFFLSLGASLVLFTMVLWWRDVIREASFLGCHTSLVQRGLKAGVLLFILSEVCLFFSFFWAFFHSSLAPTVELGAVWPPRGLRPLDPFAVPLLNTAVLLSSGATVTLAHHSLLSGRLRVAKAALFLTIVLGAVFSFLQATEYLEASFSIADSVFGSVFFVTTGAHGAHVLIGSTFLLICLLRLHHFSDRHHLGFEAAAWYWHFVDVV